jgi:hypothetical protein
VDFFWHELTWTLNWSKLGLRGWSLEGAPNRWTVLLNTDRITFLEKCTRFSYMDIQTLVVCIEQPQELQVIKGTDPGFSFDQRVQMLYACTVNTMPIA